MQIRDLVQHPGVPAKIIRYYEQIRLLPSPARTANNYRRYEPAVMTLRVGAKRHRTPALYRQRTQPRSGVGRHR